MKNIIFTIAAFILFASAAFAQGSVEGTITDAKGKPVAGIKVTVFGVDGKAVASVTTGADGAYSFEDIAAGKYKVAAFNIDYKEPVIRDGVTVEDDDIATVDITMGAKRPIPTSPKPTPTPSPASPKGYVPEMTALIAELTTVATDTSSKEFLGISGRFEKIGDAQKTEWLPYYYSALAVYLGRSLRVGDFSDDPRLDRGLALISKAQALSKDNSEILVLKAILLNAKVDIEPMSRYPTVGAEAADALLTAKRLDAGNPRVYLVLGETYYRTPEPYGGGPAAKPLFEEALKKFDAFKPQNSLSPNWGRENVVRWLSLYR